MPSFYPLAPPLPKLYQSFSFCGYFIVRVSMRCINRWSEPAMANHKNLGRSSESINARNGFLCGIAIKAG